MRDDKVDYPEFKRLMETVGQEITALGDSKKRAKKQKTDDPAVEPVLANPLDPTRKVAPSISSFLEKVDWNIQTFVKEYRANIVFMNAKNNCYDRMQRVDKRLGQRLVVMSGLTWNLDSKKHYRDWLHVGLCATLETAIIPTYRTDLLAPDACHGARALRSRFVDYFTTIVLPFVDTFSGFQPGTPDASSVLWTFADGIHVAPSPAHPKVYDPNTVHQALQSIQVSAAASKKDPILALVEFLEKNKYLHCSDEDAAPGTVEASAHYHITALINVSSPFPSSPPSPFPHIKLFLFLLFRRS